MKDILSPKPQKLTSIPFVVGQDSNTITLGIQKVCKEVDFCISGTITLSGLAGTVVAAIGTAVNGTILIPYLLFLAGSLTFNGQRLDGRPGVQVQKIPIWLLWLESFLLNGGNGPIVSDGGMQVAGFANGVYNVSINFSLPFYDPASPVKQHGFSFFRPLCYQKNPTFVITGGNFFQAGYLANSDNVATTGNTASSSSVTAAINMTIAATATLIPSMMSASNDVCVDVAYEYLKYFNITQANYNQIVLAALGVQGYLTMVETALSAAGGGGTALLETGTNSLGSVNNGIIETDIGTDPIAQPYESNLLAAAQRSLMSGQSVIPTGVTVINEYGSNFGAWNTKTFLQPGIASHYLNANGAPAQGGSNFRILHKTFNPSQTAFSKYAPFPRFAGQ